MSIEQTEVQAEIKSSCEEIPLRTWHKIGYELKIASLEASDLLPLESSDLINGRRVPGNGDELEIVLVRNGRLIEKLVHYVDDTEGKNFEILGEGTPESYNTWHQQIMAQLKHLKTFQP